MSQETRSTPSSTPDDAVDVVCGSMVMGRRVLSGGAGERRSVQRPRPLSARCRRRLSSRWLSPCSITPSHSPLPCASEQPSPLPLLLLLPDPEAHPAVPRLRLCPPRVAVLPSPGLLSCRGLTPPGARSADDLPETSRRVHCTRSISPSPSPRGADHAVSVSRSVTARGRCLRGARPAGSLSPPVAVFDRRSPERRRPTPL